MERSYEELAVNKLYILYILQKIEIPLTNAQIIHIFMENDLLDYFSLQQYFHELKEGGLISSTSEDGTPHFVISEKGKTVLNYFKSRIPAATLQNLESYISEQKENIKKQREISVFMQQNPQGDYQIHLKILDYDNPYINLQLKVPTARTARLICDNWKEHSSEIYSHIIETLIRPKKEKGS